MSFSTTPRAQPTEVDGASDGEYVLASPTLPDISDTQSRNSISIDEKVRRCIRRLRSKLDYGNSLCVGPILPPPEEVSDVRADIRRVVGELETLGISASAEMESPVGAASREANDVLRELAYLSVDVKRSTSNQAQLSRMNTPMFDGKVETYLQFRAKFHDVVVPNTSGRMAFLKLRDEALRSESPEHMMVCGTDNLQDAFRVLDDLFAEEENVRNALISRLNRVSPISRMSDSGSLRALVALITTTQFELRQLGVIDCFESATFSCIMTKLPQKLREDIDMEVHQEKLRQDKPVDMEKRFAILIKQCKLRAALSETHKLRTDACPIAGARGRGPFQPRYQHPNPQEFRQGLTDPSMMMNSRPGTGTGVNTGGTNQFGSVPSSCLFHPAATRHRTATCNKLKSMPVSEIKATMTKSFRCYRCYEPLVGCTTEQHGCNVRCVEPDCPTPLTHCRELHGAFTSASFPSVHKVNTSDLNLDQNTQTLPTDPLQKDEPPSQDDDEYDDTGSGSESDSSNTMKLSAAPCMSSLEESPSVDDSMTLGKHTLRPCQTGVYVKAIDGKLTEAKVFYDLGSDISEVTYALVKKTSSRPVNVIKDLTMYVAGSEVATSFGSSELHELPLYNASGRLLARVRVAAVDHIGKVRSANIDKVLSKFTEVGLDVSDVRYPVEGTVDILLGCNFANLHPRPIMVVDRVVLSECPLAGGKIIYGSHESFPNQRSLHCSYSAVPTSSLLTSSPSCSLASTGLTQDEVDMFDRMTALENPVSCAKCGDICSPVDRENSRREEIYRECLQFQPEEKRVIAKMPWTRDLANVPDNRISAMKQLMRLTKSVSKDSRLLSSYVPAFDSMIEQGILVEVTAEEDRLWQESGGAVWYVGHFPVVNEGSESTPVRPVFDPSIPFRGVILSKLWERPPNMVPNIVSMYLRFRERPVAVCLDFKKVYWQVHLLPVESHMHRVLYNHLDPAQSVKTYRMTRNSWGMVPAGAICSLAMLTVAEHFRPKYPHIYDFIKTQVYVDDGTASCETVNEALILARDTHWVMSQGGFSLKHFIVGGQSVSEGLLKINPDLPDVVRMGRDQERILGAVWFPQQDTISFSCKINFSKRRHGSKSESDVTEAEYDSRFPEKLTLRMYLSVISTLFDPLGLACPVTILLKHEFGRLLTLGLKWNDPVPHGPVEGPTYERCKVLIKSLYGIAKVRFPRCVRPRDIPDQRPVLVGFADSSQMAYAACVYVNWNPPSGPRVSTLIIAKAKPFPKKAPVMTIPRGELLACEMLANLIKIVVSTSTYQFEDIFLLTDSMIALGQISSVPSKLKVWPAMRVERILERTDVKNWYHIESSQNAADSATRGLSPGHLSGTWQSGANFMQQPVVEWPVTPIREAAPKLGETSSIDTMLEGRHRDPRMVLNRTPSVHVQSVALGDEACLDLVLYVSELKFTEIHVGDSWIRLKRRVARVIHFILNLSDIYGRRADLPAGFSAMKRSDQRVWIEANDHYSPTPFEMSIAELVWIKKAQSAMTAKSLGSMAKLNPVRDQFGLWRAVTRVHNVGNAPAIIPADHPLASVIMIWFHRKAHSSADTSLACVREKFWLIRGQILANRVVASCVQCRKLRKRPVEIQMSPLDSCRTQRYPVFSVVLVDLCGPYMSKADYRDTRQRPVLTGQIWILVVICSASHAVHLETVEGYGTAGFLSAFDNFVSLRGMPSRVYADQGSQIKSAGGTLQSLWDGIDVTAIRNKFCENTDWQFVPSGAHWFVGMAERLVKSVKTCIEVSTLATHPEMTKLQFSRLLYSTANVINSRPLTVGRNRVSAANEMRLIRPNDLLLGRSSPEVSNCIPTDDVSNVSNKRQHFLKLLSVQASFLNQFWLKFQQVVFHTLMPRSKWLNSGRELAVDDVVLVRDTNPVRGVWTWGQIERVVKSESDGKVRQAVVRYKTGLGLSAKEKLAKGDGNSKRVLKSVRDLCLLLETDI